jgi:hypothetical protein
VVRFMPRPLYLGAESRYPLNRRLGGAQSRSGSFGEEENPLPLLGFEPKISQPAAFPRPATKLDGFNTLLNAEHHLVARAGCRTTKLGLRWNSTHLLYINPLARQTLPVDTQTRYYLEVNSKSSPEKKPPPPHIHTPGTLPKAITFLPSTQTLPVSNPG